jgi:predicted component of type VI protein secretion system
MKPIARAVLLLSVGAAALASCMSSSKESSPPPGTKTYWLAENTSEIDLKLATAQPTVPF